MEGKYQKSRDAQWRIMRYMAKRGEAFTVKSIAMATEAKPGTVNKFIGELRAAGLIERASFVKKQGMGWKLTNDIGPKPPIKRANGTGTYNPNSGALLLKSAGKPDKAKGKEPGKAKTERDTSASLSIDYIGGARVIAEVLAIIFNKDVSKALGEAITKIICLAIQAQSVKANEKGSAAAGTDRGGGDPLQTKNPIKRRPKKEQTGGGNV